MLALHFWSFNNVCAYFGKWLLAINLKGQNPLSQLLKTLSSKSLGISDNSKLPSDCLENRGFRPPSTPKAVWLCMNCKHEIEFVGFFASKHASNCFWSSFSSNFSPIKTKPQISLSDDKIPIDCSNSPWNEMSIFHPYNIVFFFVGITVLHIEPLSISEN